MSDIIDLSEAFWDSQYRKNDTGWDIGCVSSPLKMYIDQLEDKGDG